LSITRNRLLEVNYSLRVTLSAGALRTADVQVALPIRIANFLSVDPPPSFPLASQENRTEHPDVNNSDTASTLAAGPLQRNPHSRPVVAGLFDSHGPNSGSLASLAEADDESPTLPSEQSGAEALQHGSAESLYDDSEVDGEYPELDDETGRPSIYREDTDESSTRTRAHCSRGF
jgi:hypothetical protein